MAVQNNGGNPVDGEVIINVLPNYSVAYMSIYPPRNGGKEVTYDSVIAALKVKGVKHNINTELIRSLIDSKDFDREIKAAEADMPVDGKNGTITYNYDKEQVIAPQEDENGFVDYKNLGLIRNIHENDVIAVITPPEDGTDGVDVRGVVMKAAPGKPAPYSVGKGTRLTDDGLSIVAAIDGHVCYRDKGFCVEPVVTIKGDVDASVGNIDFLGDVVIKGEIMEGFSVTAGKDITVGGNVTNAKLTAGGSITIKKGAINSKLTAHGNITCQFCEYSEISTDSDLNAQNFVICTVYCGGDLTAKGVNGGKYTVLGNTEVTYLGTKNYAATEITAGDNAMLSQEKNECLKKISELESTIDRCNQIAEFLTAKRKELKKLPEDKEELLGSAIKTKFSSQNEIKQIRKRIANIDESLNEIQQCYVSVKGIAYPGSKVIINEAMKKFESETPRVKIYLDENGLLTTGTV
ncbi:MAG: FapA family protein [Oscillospiraceae bacterium]|nr:FapA family protein [Oscillospiraceae bacterium]